MNQHDIIYPDMLRDIVLRMNPCKIAGDAQYLISNFLSEDEIER